MQLYRLQQNSCPNCPADINSDAGLSPHVIPICWKNGISQFGAPSASNVDTLEDTLALKICIGMVLSLRLYHSLGVKYYRNTITSPREAIQI